MTSIDKPTPGADDGTWGGILNTALDALAAAIDTSAAAAAHVDRDLRAGLVYPPPPGLLLPGPGDPPTVTLSAGNAGTAITGGVQVMPFDASEAAGSLNHDPRFLFFGGAVLKSDTAPAGYWLYQAAQAPNGAGRQGNVAVSFMHDGDELEILENGWTGKVKILVDGAVITTGPNGWTATATDGELYRRHLAWTDRRHRLITVLSSDNQWPGVTVGPTDGLYAPPMPRIPRAIALGDSVTQGQNNDAANADVWTTYLSGLLGWDIWESGQGGTGWLNPGVYPGFAKFRDRLPTHVTPWGPDVVFFAGGLNDQDASAYPSAARRAEVTATLAAARAALPNALLVVVGPFYGSDGQAAVDAVHADLSATAVGDRVLFIPTQGVMTGTGYGGTGPSSVYTTNDGVHPTRAGHERWARHIAARLIPKLAAL